MQGCTHLQFKCFLERINPCMPSCHACGKKTKHLQLKKELNKTSTMATDLSASCILSHKAFKINNKHLAKGKHAQVYKLRPSPQSRQPIALSLFFLLWWSVVLNSWHISPHILTSKIAFCQYEGKDSFGFNDVRQLMSGISRTIENNLNVYNMLSVFDCFLVCMKEWETSSVQITWKHLSKWQLPSCGVRM